MAGCVAAVEDGGGGSTLVAGFSIAIRIATSCALRDSISDWKSVGSTFGPFGVCDFVFWPETLVSRLTLVGLVLTRIKVGSAGKVVTSSSAAWSVGAGGDALFLRVLELLGLGVVETGDLRPAVAGAGWRVAMDVFEAPAFPFWLLIPGFLRKIRFCISVGFLSFFAAMS